LEYLLEDNLRDVGLVELGKFAPMKSRSLFVVEPLVDVLKELDNNAFVLFGVCEYLLVIGNITKATAGKTEKASKRHWRGKNLRMFGGLVYNLHYKAEFFDQRCFD
jgi:hypothetical protein